MKRLKNSFLYLSVIITVITLYNYRNIHIYLKGTCKKIPFGACKCENNNCCKIFKKNNIK